MRTHRPAADFVRWCFSPVPSTAPAVAERDVERIRQLLTHHRGWGLLHARRSRAPGAPAVLIETAATVTHQTTVRQLAMQADLLDVARLLDRAGLDWIIVKGPVLAEGLYSSPEQRPHGDLDVLVGPAELRAAVKALERGSWVVLDRNWDLARARMSGELHLQGPHGTVTDLHWSLQNRAGRRDRVHVDAVEVLRRAVPVVVAARAMRTSSPADTVVHLSMHACGDGADRLLALSDVGRLLEQDGVDLAGVVERAMAWGASGPTALVCRRAARALDLDLPPWFLAGLDPGPVTMSMDDAVDRLFPVASVAGHGSWPARWARRRVDAPTGWPLRLPRRRRASTFEEHADNPWSLFHESGGEAGREAYLAAVERGAR